MNDNINMNNIIAGSMNDNINMATQNIILSLQPLKILLKVADLTK